MLGNLYVGGLAENQLLHCTKQGWDMAARVVDGVALAAEERYRLAVFHAAGMVVVYSMHSLAHSVIQHVRRLPMSLDCQCKSFLQRHYCGRHCGCLDTCWKWVVVMKWADHTWHSPGCMCWTIVLQACDHSSAQQWKALHAGREVYRVCSSFLRKSVRA